MHTVSLKQNIRNRRHAMSAEVRFIMRKLLERLDSDETGIDPGDVLQEVLVRTHQDTSWWVRRFEDMGFTLDVLSDGLRGTPRNESESAAAMKRFFELLDEMAEQSEFGRVFTEGVAMACLAADSELIDLIVTKGVEEPEVTVRALLAQAKAPEALLDAYDIRMPHLFAFDRVTMPAEQ